MDKLSLPYFNTTNYPLAVKNQLLSQKYSDNESKLLKYHQFIVKQFYTKTNIRGILICHGMGQGKTRLAVSIAHHIRTYDNDRKVIVLSAKSLAANFKKEIKSYLANGGDEDANTSENVDKVDTNEKDMNENKVDYNEKNTNKDANTNDNLDNLDNSDEDANINEVEEVNTNNNQINLSIPNNLDNYIESNYKFISLNASNMYKQMSNVDKTDEQAALENKLGDFMNDVVRDSSLENSLLIIDEAHNLFNAITNGAKNAVALYDLIMETKNIRIIFMSGTPIINDPFELVPCFNMIKGYLKVENAVNDNKFSSRSGKKFNNSRSSSSSGTTLFSEDIKEFDSYFVDRDNKTIKNKDKFTNRIFGLCSYYGDLYFPTSDRKQGFPEELPTIVEKVPMSETQFGRYISARNAELEETKRGYRAKDSRFSSSTGGSSTYRVKSRQISNYCIPEYALGPARGNKSREKFLDKITIEDLQNVKEFSPKIAKILKNMEKHSGPGIVYSQFVSGEGLGIFSKILEAIGWKLYGNKDDETAYGLPSKSGKTYGILSGDIDPEQRTELINHFNSTDSTINLLLLSGAVAEGIDLKRIRHVHIMEPFWNYARINQVKTRAIRYLSHSDLPEDQQNVQVYIYLSDYPEKYPSKKIKEPTTDVDLYNMSINNMKIIDTFMLAIAEASIDCLVHYPKLSENVSKLINCKLCAPTDQPLFHPLLRKDMELPNNCKSYVEKKVEAHEIVLADTEEKFYYTENKGDIKLYHYSEKLKGYTPLPRSHPLFGALMESVLEKTTDK